MGMIKQAVPGGFSGKVGTVIGSSWNRSRMVTRAGFFTLKIRVNSLIIRKPNVITCLTIKINLWRQK